jgi:hypothetical protein
MLLIPAAAAPLQAADRRLLAASDSQTGGNDLNVAQTSLDLGWSVPVVFGKREDGAGGVWMSPLASECRFENDNLNQVTASYQLVLSAGQLPTIQLGDIYQGDTPLVIGEYQQAYNGRAGTWTPGNLIQQRFIVTTSNRQETIVGDKIGGALLEIRGYSTLGLAAAIAEAMAETTVSTSGNYITRFEITIDKKIDWPSSGGTTLHGIPRTTSIQNPSTEWYNSLSFFQVYNFLDYDKAAFPGTYRYVELYEANENGLTYGLLLSAKNSGIHARADKARYLNISSYSFNRPASVEPYGNISIYIYETVRGGFLQTVTAVETVNATGAYYETGAYGGLAGVTYTLNILEENSEPTPKPEATLHCGTGGSYADLTTLSVTKQYPAENEGWRRHIHVFARNGTPVPRLIEGTAGSSNLFPDLAKYAMLQSQEIDASQIDNNFLLLSARFNAANAITCDGLAVAPANIAEWLDVMAPLFLLRPTNHNGRIGLRPAIPITDTYQFNTAPLVPVAIFNEANIIGPPSIQGIPAEDRRWQVGILPRWREQPETNVGIIRASGPFRFNGVSDGSPVEVVDASEWVTRELHAVRLAALELARRRYVEHRATIQVEPSLAIAALAPGSIVAFSQAINPSVGRSGDWSYYYYLLAVSGPPLGPWTLELEHHPTDQTGASLLAQVVAAARIA